MYKKVIVTIITIIVLPLAGFAAGNLSYEAYKSDAMISFNDMDVNFQLPVVTINGNTYVPLREAAEKLGMTVDWNVPEWYENQKNIRIVRNIPDIDAKEAFQNLFGFALPETAEVLNYEYYDYTIYEEEKEKHFVAKISFQEQDLEYLKNQFNGWREGSTLYYKVLSQEYGWWDFLSRDEVLYAYETTQKGTYVETIYVDAFITKPSDGQYYLYISR